jgi:Fe-S cluster assembly protein SufD
VITATQAPEKYLEIFDQLKARTMDQFVWLQKQRQEAFDRFAETGFPTTHDEDWRFTNVAAVANTEYDLSAPVKVN